MEIEKLKDVLEENRNATADYHARLGRFWRMFGKPDKLHAPLAYAAFEFRVAMERMLLELLYVINNQRLSKDELKYDCRRLQKALYKTQSRGRDGKEKLQRRMEFNAIYAKHLPPPFKLPKRAAIIDIDKISKFWGKLSEYCHRQLKAKNTWGDIGWVNNGYELLNEVESYVWDMMVDYQVGWFEPTSLPKRIQEVAKDFIEGKIDKNSLDIRLRLIIPVLLGQKGLKYSRIITLKPG